VCVCVVCVSVVYASMYGL